MEHPSLKSVNRALTTTPWATLLLAIAATPANSGPNAEGRLILHANESLQYTSDITNYCGLTGLDACANADVQVEILTTTVWFVIAAFPTGSHPSMQAVSFGLGDYDPDAIALIADGPCGAYNTPQNGWPGPGTGTIVTYQSQGDDWLKPVYWFAGYSYSDAVLSLTGHPTDGGYFLSFNVPPVVDPVVDYGVLGFGNGQGYLPCPMDLTVGACCFTSGACQVLTPIECEGGVGDYQGDGAICTPNPCPQPAPCGACCFDVGTCVWVNDLECQAQGGSWLGESTDCSPSPCPQPPGACCLLDGGCVVVPESQCNPDIWTMWGTCEPNPCPPPLGSCCRPDDSCEVLPRDECAGEWEMFGNCQPNPCLPPLGSCCRPDDSCEILPLAECVGEWEVFGSCEPNPCAPPDGACCLPNGSCSLTAFTECIGDWQGSMTTCSPNPCPVGQEGSLVGWGANLFGESDAPPSNSNLAAISGGWSYTLVLDASGSIAGWGDNRFGQCDIPSPNAGFRMISAGVSHGLGLRPDGSIAAWGWNYYGQCDVPVPNSDFVAVAGGADHSLAIRADGSVAAWGSSAWGQCNVPAPNIGFTAVAGVYHSLGLKSDGTIVGWGHNAFGQCDVPAPNADFVAIAAGVWHSVGLKIDGSVVTWGSNQFGQCDVPSPNSDFVAVEAGADHSLGLKSNGTIVAWGGNDLHQCEVPESNQGFTAISAGGYHSLGLVGIPSGSGACCVTAGSCLIATVATCLAPDIWQGAGSLCTPQQCSPPRGACCFGTCEFLPASFCPPHGGTFLGEDTPCEPETCPTFGACCDALTGACAVAAPTDCQLGAPRYTYLGDGTLCSPNPCPEPTGACCLADEGCEQMNESDCAAAGGAFLGLGSSCESCATAVGDGSGSYTDSETRAVPNPSIGQSQISYSIGASGPVAVKVFDAAGRLRRVLFEGQLPAGEHTLAWDGRDAGRRDLPGGVYFVRVTTERGSATKPIVVAR